MSAVSLSSYSTGWPELFVREKALFLSAFASCFVEVEHIGSTAVPGLVAKPTIDMLVGVQSLSEVESRIGRLAELGFSYVPKHEAVLPERRFFTRSTGSNRISHVHAVVMHTTFWHEHLAFRDALCKSEALATQYAGLKQSLASRFANDREAYTNAKAPFIRGVLATVSSEGPGV